MFIPRTLAQDGSSAPARGMGRALIVERFSSRWPSSWCCRRTSRVGQENLAVGDDRPARHPRAARRDVHVREPHRGVEAQAADEVVPVTETVNSPTDNQEDQLLAYDTMVRRVARVLELRDRGSLEGDEVIDRLSNDAPLIPVRLATADLPTSHRSLGGDLGGRPRGRRRRSRRSVREDKLFEARSRVRDHVTTDLAAAGA